MINKKLMLFEQWMNEVTTAKQEYDQLYKYSPANTIFRDFDAYLKNVMFGRQPAIIVTGSPGVGKSYGVTKAFENAGLVKDKDYIRKKGKTTAAGLYVTLYMNNGKFIVFDDCDSVFDDPNGVDILKGALDTDDRTISWDSSRPLKTPSGEVVPNSFKFSGKAIFLTNRPKRTLDGALRTRSNVLEVALSPKDMLKYIDKRLKEVKAGGASIWVKKSALNILQTLAKEYPAKVKINFRTLDATINILLSEPDLNDAQRMILQQMDN